MSDETEDARERETLPPPPPEESRELRRTQYVLGAHEHAYDEITTAAIHAAPRSARAVVEEAIRAGRSKGIALAALHLGRAWDDGAACETDLRMSVSILLNELMTLQAQFGELKSVVAQVRATQEARDGAAKEI